MSDDPSDGWERLRTTGIGDGNLEVPSLSTGIESGFGPAVYAIGPDAEPRLLVPCGDVRIREDLGSSANLIARPITLVRKGVGIRFLDVMVTNRQLDAVFAELVSEVLLRLKNGTSPVEAVRGTIADFRDLILAKRRDDVSVGEICGLIGELLVLERLCGKSADGASTWTGPYEQRHDFRKGARAIEVKSSMRADSSHIKVNGVEQLKPPTGGALNLIHVRLERSESADLTVQSMHSRLRDIVADHLILETGLARLGCVDPTDEAWNAAAFHLEGIDLYRVDEDFPCVTPGHFVGGEVPKGVDYLVYEVDLGHATSQRVSKDDHDEFFREFMR